MTGFKNSLEVGCKYPAHMLRCLPPIRKHRCGATHATRLSFEGICVARALLRNGSGIRVRVNRRL